MVHGFTFLAVESTAVATAQVNMGENLEKIFGVEPLTCGRSRYQHVSQTGALESARALTWTCIHGQLQSQKSFGLTHSNGAAWSTI